MYEGYRDRIILHYQSGKFSTPTEVSEADNISENVCTACLEEVLRKPEVENT